MPQRDVDVTYQHGVKSDPKAMPPLRPANALVGRDWAPARRPADRRDCI